MGLKEKILLKNLRRKLTPKEIAAVKLALWGGIISWMVLFATQAVVISKILSRWAPQFFPQTPQMQIMAKGLPIWFLFTVALIIFLVGRFTYRKLVRKNKKKELDNDRSQGSDNT